MQYVPILLVMSVSAMTRLTITLPAETAERLDAFARDTDRSVSGVVRFALRPLLNETPSPHHRGSPAAEAEPRGTGSRQPVPRLDPQEQPMPDLDTPTSALPHSLHLAHLTRVGETARRQAAETQAARDAAVARSAEYIGKMGKSE